MAIADNVNMSTEGIRGYVKSVVDGYTEKDYIYDCGRFGFENGSAEIEKIKQYVLDLLMILKLESIDLADDSVSSVSELNRSLIDAAKASKDAFLIAKDRQTAPDYYDIKVSFSRINAPDGDHRLSEAIPLIIRVSEAAADYFSSFDCVFKHFIKDQKQEVRKALGVVKADMFPAVDKVIKPHFDAISSTTAEAFYLGRLKFIV